MTRTPWMPALLCALAGWAAPLRAEDLAPPPDATAFENAVCAAIARAAPAVVKILVEREIPPSTRRPAQTQQRTVQDLLDRLLGRAPQAAPAPEESRPEASRESASVTGFVVDADGWILTSDWNLRHAVSVRVVLGSGAIAVARIHGRDVQRNVALLKIDAKKLPTLAWGDSRALEVGRFAMAVGKTLSAEAPNVSFGIISAVTRQFGFLQSDCDVNPGNEGGPLLNLRGEVVGMCLLDPQTVEMTGIDSGIGFALPAHLIERSLPDLKAGRIIDRTQERAYIGIEIDPAFTGLGCRIAKVQKGTGAEEAGLQQGDVIINAGSRVIDSPQDLLAAIGEFRAGDALRLTVQRDDQERDFVINLGIHPQSPGAEQPKKE